MILRVTLLTGAALLAGAAPPSGFSTNLVLPPIIAVRPQALGNANTPPGFQPAPLPNRDASAPRSRASKDASVSPGLFMRRNQYRGEGLSAADSAQSEENRRVQPGASLNLSMPLQ